MMKKGLLLLPVLALPVLYGGFQLAIRTPRKEKPLWEKRRIACIGDSITFGAGVVARRKKEAWPYLVARRLGEGFQTLNYGISGATALLESEVVFKKSHDFVDAAIDAKPELYLMMLGTNDAKTVNWRADDFYRDYNRMIDRMQSGSPQAEIVLMTPPTAYPDPKLKDGMGAFGIDCNTVHNETVPMVRKIAEERGLPVVDIHSFTADHPDWFDDGIHPNAEGNRQMAEYIAAQIAELLK